MSLAEARQRASELIQRTEAGAPLTPPVLHPRAVGTVTVGDLLDRYEAMRRREGKRIKSLPKAMQTLRRELKHFLALPAKSLGKADLRGIRDGLVERGSVAAAALFLRTLGPVLRWAATEDLIEVNHVPSVRKPALRSRERVLSASEISRVWAACDGFETDSGRAFGRLVRFLLATAQRREEAALLRHRDIAGRNWHQVDNKSNRPHTVPLSALALELVGMADDRNTLVFRGRTGKLAGFSKLKARLDKASVVKDWTLHDLRRTAATGMQDAGVAREVVDAVLNHSIPGVGGIYMRSQMEKQKREALDGWARELANIIGNRNAAAPPLEVVG
jgi:integrase